MELDNPQDVVWVRKGGPPGEGGRNTLLSPVNIYLTLVVVDTTLWCTPLTQVRHMCSFLY